MPTTTTSITEGVEHIAHAVEEGAHAVQQSHNYPLRNLVAIVGIAATLFGTVFGIGGSYLVNQYRLSEMEMRLTEVIAADKEARTHIWDKLSFLIDHGRDEDQRRIVALESQKSGELALIVAEQGRQISLVTHQISDVTSALKSDHDSLTRILTLMENRDKRESK